MGGYYPSYSNDWQPPPKRRRAESDNHPSRPDTHPSQPHQSNIESYRPDYHARRRQKPDAESSNPQSTPKYTSGHTKKERKTNPSTRIHSLKKLLSNDILPPEQRRDKERELSSLLFDQEKDRIAKATKQMIGRYHMVRFFERKKAERKLKQLLKAKDGLRIGATDLFRTSTTPSEDEMKQQVADLEKKIHSAEVDVNYTMYSPLGEKYISIFVEEDMSKKDQKRKKRLHAMLQDQAQQKELRFHEDEAANLARLGVEGAKPPVWYEVEKCMENEDAEVVQKSLVALKDRKPVALEAQVAVRGAVTIAAENVTGQKRKSAWLDEDGHIDPADLDADDDNEDGGVRLPDAEEDASDGGFFDE